MNNPMHTTSRQRFKNLGQKVIIVVFFCLTFFLGRIIFSSFKLLSKTTLLRFEQKSTLPCKSPGQTELAELEFKLRKIYFLGKFIQSQLVLHLVEKWKTNYDSPDGKYIFISLNSISGHFVNNQLAAQCCRGRGVKILKIFVELHNFEHPVIRYSF